MRFTLSAKSPLNSIYTNESGEAIYKVTTPQVLTGRTSTISRVLPSDLTGGDHDGQDNRFGHLATIRYYVGKADINFGGEEINTNEHFNKAGLLWRDKSCTGPDGKAYKWRIRRYWGCEFCREDDDETVIARFLDRTLGVIGPARQASLEIFPAGEEIMDYIFVTFIFVEKIRRDRKKG